MTHTGTKPRGAPCCPHSSQAGDRVPMGSGHQHQARCCHPLLIPAPPQPRGMQDVWGGQLPPAPGRRAEVGTEERAINKCKYSKEAPGQSCEGHSSVCQQISNPPPQWHLTKCHCE